MARKNPSSSKGAFAWNTTAYANFNTLQKVIFWLWPLAVLNYVFIVYWFIVFLSNRKKPLQDRRETYIRALYYYNIFWLCAVAVIVAILAVAFSGHNSSEACGGFYCESQAQFGNDERCENTAFILGQDDSCYPPCGSATEYCADVNSYCYHDDCVSCPVGTTLFADGNCSSGE